MPTTRPNVSVTGPPELPGYWGIDLQEVFKHWSGTLRIPAVRPKPLTMPLETLNFNSSGEPKQNRCSSGGA